MTSDRNGAAALLLASADDAVWLWPALRLTEKQGDKIRRLSADWIGHCAGQFLGHAVHYSGLMPALDRAVAALNGYDPAAAAKALVYARLPPL